MLFFIFKGIDILRFLLNNLLRVYFDDSRKYPTSKHSPTKGPKCYYLQKKKKKFGKNSNNSTKTRDLRKHVGFF